MAIIEAAPATTEGQTGNVQVNRPEQVSPIAASNTPPEKILPTIAPRTSLASEQYAFNLPSYDNVVDKMASENINWGKADGKVLEPSGAIYLGIQAVDSASALSGMGILSLGMAAKSIIARAIFGREAANAARSWVESNAERGWGPFRFLHRVATAPARFLSNMSYHHKVFDQLRPFAGEEGAKNISSLSPKRAMELAAYGMAAGSIYKSASTMAPEDLDVKTKLGHLPIISETGKAIFDKEIANLEQANIRHERKILWIDSVKQRAQIVEDAIYTTARTGYILGTNVLLGATAWTWNAMGRSFGFVEKAWNEKVVPFAQSTWDKVTGFARDIGTKATDLYNEGVKAVKPYFPK